MFNLTAHHLSYNLPDIDSKFYAMSTQLQRMTIRAKNANQHPGYVQMKLHKLSVPADKPKVKKVGAKAAKPAKATTKEVSTEHASKYEHDAIPCPNFNSTTSCHHSVPASDPSAPSMVSESNMDTDEMNPDKGTYRPGSTTKDDFSVVSSHKMTYVKVASPKKAGPNNAKQRTAPLSDNSEMEPDSVPSQSPTPQGTKITAKSTKGGANQQTSLQKNGSILPGFTYHDSLATPAPLNPKTPMQKRKGGQ